MSCGPRTAEAKIICGAGAAPKGWYMVGTGRGKSPSPVRHILVSWRGRSLVSVGFSPYPTPCDTDEPAG